MSYISKIYSLKSEADELRNVLEEVEDKIIKVLEEAVASGDFDDAISVFMEIEDMLPSYSDVGFYDQDLKELLEKRMGHRGRRSYVPFCDLLEEELYFYWENQKLTDEPDIFTRKDYERFMWAIMKSGRKGFTYDW